MTRDRDEGKRAAVRPVGEVIQAELNRRSRLRIRVPAGWGHAYIEEMRARRLDRVVMIVVDPTVPEGQAVVDATRWRVWLARLCSRVAELHIEQPGRGTQVFPWEMRGGERPDRRRR